MRTKLRPLDVLVIVTVLLVVASLVVPALAEMRNRARRTQCERNLAALGKAMLSYHEAERTFPPGIIAGGEGPVPFGGPAPSYVAMSKRCDNAGIAQTSALTLILPFLDQGRTFEAYNQSLASCAVQNATAVATKISAFVCPASAFENTEWGYYKATPGIAARGPAITDYALSAGGAGLISDDYPRGGWPKYEMAGYLPSPPVMSRASGVFNVNWGARSDRIKDGAAHTFLMGEAFSGAHAALKSDGRLSQGDEALGGVDSSIIVKTPWSQSFLGSEPKYEREGRIENFGGYGSVFAVTAWNAWSIRGLTDSSQWFPIVPNEGGREKARATFYKGPRPLFGVLPNDGTAMPGSLGSVQGFRSLHPTMPMLFADGSIRQLQPTIDPWLWVALSTDRGYEELLEGF